MWEYLAVEISLEKAKLCNTPADETTNHLVKRLEQWADLAWLDISDPEGEYQKLRENAAQKVKNLNKSNRLWVSQF